MESCVVQIVEPFFRLICHIVTVNNIDLTVQLTAHISFCNFSDFSYFLTDSGGMLDRPCTLTGSPENIE